MPVHALRLLHVNYEYPPLGGGGGTAHQDLAEALAQQHAVVVLTTHFRGLPREETRRGVRIVRVPVLGRTALPTATLRSMVTFAPLALRAGLQLARRFRPHVIHAFFAVPSGLPAVVVGRLTRIPTILTLVGADVYDPLPTAGIATHENPFVRAVIRRVIRTATVRTAISEDTKRSAERYHQAPSDIAVIPLGLVPPRVPLEPTATADGRFHLVTVGRLIPRKATGDLLCAISLLPPGSTHLQIVGDGPLRPEIERQAAALDIREAVTFTGTLTEAEKWRCLASADCFVSASRYEGFGMVFLEAMYAGLPIIATGVGGQTDVLAAGENALLVPPAQPSQMAAAIRLLMREPSLRARLADANRRKVKDYLIEHTAAAYERLAQQLVGAKARIPIATVAAPPPSHANDRG